MIHIKQRSLNSFQLINKEMTLIMIIQNNTFEQQIICKNNQNNYDKIK